MGFSVSSAPLGRLNVQVGYTVDKTGLNELRTLLNEVVAKGQNVGQSISTGLQQATVQAQQLTGMLAAATDPKSGALNMGAFNKMLTLTGTSIGQIGSNLTQAGNEGHIAFSNLNKQILSTQTSVTKAEGGFAQLGKTITNTFMYSLSYRVIGKFIEGITNAIGYVKDLDKALTDIKIVTKESNSEMQRFAEHANKAAKELGVSTKEYTKAALIFTQQGLKGEEREARTETTMKVANVTGDNAEEVSQNLTAVWNGYKIASEDAEKAIDKLANVAAHSASNLAELSTGMSKVASAANTMGVDEDQLVAQLSTIESVTRQAPESIGTALKTIYARMGDLKVEGVDEFGTSLGEVSSKMHTMGVDILDQEGQMKEMGTVIEEVADKWDTWSQAQQQAAAIAMAGKRQYNNLISLFSNWDMYEQNIEYSQNSEGEIEAQQQEYLDSIAGMKGKMQAAWEEVYSGTFDSDWMKGFYEAFAGIGDAIANLNGPLGALTSSLTAGFLLIARIFQDRIVSGITNATLGLSDMSQQQNMIKIQQDAINNAEDHSLKINGQRVLTNQEILTATRENNAYWSEGNNARVQANREEISLAETGKMRLEIQSGLTTEEQNVFQMYEQQKASLEGLVSSEIGRVEENSQLLQLNTENLAVSDDSAIAAQQLTMHYAGATEMLSVMAKDGSVIASEFSSADAAAAEFRTQLEGTTMSTKQIDTYVKVFENIWSKASAEGLTFKQVVQGIQGDISRLGGASAGINEATLAMDQLGMAAQRLQQRRAIVQGFTSGLMALSMGIMSINSLARSLSDPDTSGWEKFSSVLMSTTMVLFSLKQGWTAVSSVITAVTSSTTSLATATNTLTTAMHTQKGVNTATLAAHRAFVATLSEEEVQELKTIAGKVADKEINEDQARSQMMSVMSKKKGTVAAKEHTVNTALETWGTKTNTAATDENTKAQVANNAVRFWMIAVIALVVAAIAALIIIYVKETSAAERHRKELKKANEEARATSEALKELSDQYDELKQSLDELKDEYTTLETLSKGTEEWKEQLFKVNTVVTELVNKFPQLAEGLYVDEDGVFRITGDALANTQKTMQEAIQKKQSLYLRDQASTQEKQEKVTLDEMKETIDDFQDQQEEEKDHYSDRGDKRASSAKDVTTEDLQDYIKDVNIESATDLKNALWEHQNVKLSNEQAGKLFSYLQQARANDKTKISLLQQAAEADKDNEKFQYQGYGGTKEEELENSIAKQEYVNSVRAEIYAAVDNFDFGDDKDDDAFSNAPGPWVASYSEFIMPNGKNFDSDLRRDGDDRDVSASMLSAYAKDQAPEWLQPYITEDLISKDMQVKTTEDMDFVHYAAEQSGKKEKDLEYKSGEGIIDTNTQQVVAGWGGSWQKLVSQTEKAFVTDVYEAALKKYLDTEVDLNNDIETGTIKLAKARTDARDSEGNVDVDKLEVDQFKWKEWEQVDEDISKLEEEKKNASEARKKEIDKTIDFYKMQKESSDDIEKKVEEQKNKLSKTMQKLYEKGNMTLVEAVGNDKYVKQAETYSNKYQKGEKKKGVAVADFYEQASAQKTEEGKQAFTSSNLTEILDSINWDQVSNIEELQDIFKKNGIKTEDLTLNWEDLLEEGKELVTVSQDVKANFKELGDRTKTYLEILEDLKPGDKLTDDQYQKVIANSADPNKVTKMFTTTRDGQHLYNGTDNLGNTDPGKSALKRAVVGVQSPKEALEAATQFKSDLTGGNIGDDKTKKTKLSDYQFRIDESDSGYKDRFTTYRGNAVELVKNIEKTTDKETKARLQRDFQMINNKDYSDVYDALNNETWFDSEGKWKSSVTEENKKRWREYLSDLRTVQDDLKNGSYQPTSGEDLATLLTGGGTGVADIMNKGSIYANELGTSSEGEEQEGLLTALRDKAVDAAEALGGTGQEESAFKQMLLQTNPALEDNKVLLEAVGGASYSLMKGVEKMSSLFNDTYKDAKQGTTQYAQMLTEVSAAANNALGVDSIDEAFVSSHIGLFKRMANGDKAAIKEIQRELVKTKVLANIDVKVRTTLAQKGIDQLLTNMQNAKVDVDVNCSTKAFYTTLAKAFQDAKATVNDITAALSGIGYSITFVDGVTGESTFDMTKVKEVHKLTPDDLNIKGAADAGKDKDKGSSSGNTPNYTYEKIDKNDIDTLHDLKQAMEDLSKTLEKLNQIQDRVLGKSLIKNLDDQNKIIEKQNKNLRKQVKILSKELGQAQTDMKGLYGFKFNKKTGRITNYKKVLNERYEAYRKYLIKYNKMTAKQQESKAGQKLKAKAEREHDIWTDAKEAVSDYDSKFNDRQSKVNEMLENSNKISDNNLKKLHAMAEAIEKTNELEQIYLDYQKDILHSDKDRAFQAEYNLKTSKLTTNQLKADQTELKKLTKRMEELKKKGWSKKDYLNFSGVLDATTKAAKAYADDIKKLQDSLIDTIKLSTQAWKDYAEEIDNINKKYKFLIDTLKTYEETSKLLYGDDEYKIYTDLNKEKAEVLNGQLYTYLEQQKQAEKTLQGAQKNYDKDLKKNGNNPDKVSDEIKNALWEAEEAYRQTSQNVQSTFKELLTAIKDIYKDNIKAIFKETEEALTSGYGWDTISASMKRDKKYSDDWLDTSQRIGNIAQLTAQFEQEIAKASDYSASSQQKILLCKQEQLANLEKIDKLTQYDIDRAKAKLSLTLKQIALEEARENKSKLRLKRDSQGNYSYQYSADKEAIEKAKEEYEAAQLKMNEDSQKHLFEIMNNRQQLEQEASEKISKLFEELGDARTDKEKEAIRKEMSDVVTYYTQQLTHNEEDWQRTTQQYIPEDNLKYFNNSVGTSYATIGEAMTYDKERFNEYLYGEEGVVPMSDTGFKSMNKTTADWSKDLQKAINSGEKGFQNYLREVNNVSKNADNNLRKIITGSDKTSGLINATKETMNLRNATNTVTSAYNKQSSAIQKSIEKMQSLYAQYKTEDAEKTLKYASNLANNYGNVKANVKKAMKYITDNYKSVIKATNKMSNAANDYANAWKGVYKQKLKAASVKNSGGSGNTNTQSYTPTDPTPPKGSGYKTHNVAIPFANGGGAQSAVLYSKGKGKNKKWYTNIDGKAYNTKKEALAALTKSRTNNKIGVGDVGRPIVLYSKYKDKKKGIEYFSGPSESMMVRKPGEKSGDGTTSQGAPRHVGITTINGTKIVGVSGSFVQLEGKKDKVKSHWYRKKDIKTYFYGFDTGGYTGTWDNKNGRLALLHQKEIVLNKQDTANFLEAVKLTRRFAQDLNKYKTGFNNQISSLANNNRYINTNNTSTNKALQQHIDIKASFPNATNSSEIEKAFQQLSAKATQYAWSNKIK